MTGDTSDPTLADDLVGVTSARLAAAGVPRHERVRALRLLSILATLADTDLRVRRPLAMVASEFELAADEADAAFDALLGVGAVHLDGAAIVVGGREPSRAVRMTLHDFLDAATELDAESARPARASALLRPTSALLAAAAVAALAFVGPVVLDDPPAPVANTRDGAGESPSVDTTAATTAETRATAELPGTLSPEPVGSGREEQVGPVVVTTTSTLLTCPAGPPILDVTGTTVVGLGRLAVEGLAHNPSDESMTVEAFTLRTVVDGQQITTAGTDDALVVPPNSTVRWRTTLPVVAPAGTVVDVTLDEWHWHRTETVLDCPSP